MEENTDLTPSPASIDRRESIHPLLAVAYHEAGHAVAAMSLGRLVHKVSIKPGKSRLGSAHLGLCELQKARSKPCKDPWEASVIVLFAGMVGESQLTGHYCQIGAERDLREIKRLLCERAASESQFERLHRRLLSKTEHLLGDAVHSEAIKRIAEQLVEKTNISGRAAKHWFVQSSQRRR